MNNKLQIATLIIFVPFVLIFVSSCTVVGAGIGGIMDVTTPDSAVYYSLKHFKSRPGNVISIRLQNDEIINGRFIKIEFESFPTYLDRYETLRKELETELLLPARGDQIRVKLSDRKVRNSECVFTGFKANLDFGVIKPIMKVRGLLDLNRNRINEVMMDNIENIIDNKKTNLNVKLVRNMIIANRLYPTNTIEVLTDESVEIIHVGDIREIIKYNKKGNAFRGMLIGAGMDVVLLWLSGAVDRTVSGLFKHR